MNDKQIAEKYGIKAPLSFDELIKKYGAQHYNKWLVIAVLDNKMLGGTPKDLDVELAMLEARYKRGLIAEQPIIDLKVRMQAAADAKHKAVEEDASAEGKEKDEAKDAATDAAVDDTKEKSWTGFRSDDNGIYIESRQVKAGLKELSSASRLTQRVSGSRNTLQHLTFIAGCGSNRDKIYFMDENSDGSDYLKGPDGTETLIAHVKTMQGPRSTIKHHDFVLPGRKIMFEAWTIPPFVDEAYLTSILTLAENNGFGCSRSQGFGRVKILSCTRFEKGNALPDKRKGAKKVEKKAKSKK